MLSFTEENHLKSIFHLSNNGLKAVSTNAIARRKSIRHDANLYYSWI